jgi:hypothetical protein
MNTLEPEVEPGLDPVEALGCGVVRDRIRALQQARPRPGSRSLDPQQRASLLHELQSIMAGYDERAAPLARG